MQADVAWAMVPQPYAPRSNRFSHQRESSLSSLGSTGPASPFTQNTSNPHIVLPDTTGDALQDLQAQDPTNPNSTYYQLAKSIGPFPGYSSMDQIMPDMAYPITIPGPSGKQRRVDRSLMPTGDFGIALNSQSNPASGPSSVADETPVTPTASAEVKIGTKRNKADGQNVPKLDRTMSDIFGDELYNPGFSITSSPPQPSLLAPSPSNELFSQRLNTANHQHLSATQSPISSGSVDRSPFRTTSPMLNTKNQDPVPGNNPQFGQDQRMRGQRRPVPDMQVFQPSLATRPEPETPKTISPKDAILEFSESEVTDNNALPLFPPEASNFDADQLAKVLLPHGAMNGGTGAGHMNYLPQLSTGISIPQQYPYPFVPKSLPPHDSPPRLSSAGSSSPGSMDDGTATARPSKTIADGGTYTCTYHGCSLRFETPALLQKHKREGHRQVQTANGTRPTPTAAVPPNAPPGTLLNTQAGPHRCDRINPSTGKSCNTVFSRPYDLTRHEDTIHNARKQKVRCNLCTEEKTFSRADALTRHYRVCHPNVELPGKHRRRVSSHVN